MTLNIPRCLLFLALFCLSHSASAADDPIRMQKQFNEFDLKVAKSIYKVVPTNTADPAAYFLMPSRISMTNAPPRDPKIFTFFGENLAAERVVCEQGTILRLFRDSNVDSAISVGICAQQRERIIALLKHAPAAIKVVADHLKTQQGQQSTGSYSDALVKAGLYYNKKVLADGSELYYSPLPFFGLWRVGNGIPDIDRQERCVDCSIATRQLLQKVHGQACYVGKAMFRNGRGAR